jgi:hypothetical protein
MAQPILRRPRRAALARVSLLVALAAFPATHAAAQVPDEFTNLKVFPKDVSKERLTAVMRGFTQALGVRCSTCHVGEEGLPLGTYDFASDDKAMKLKAREMMKMVQAINGDFLTNLPGRRPARAVNVTCWTCHRGVHKPEPIQSIVKKTLDEEDLDFAVDQYRKLRDQYYGSASYDFSERPLVELARELADENPAAAQRFLELNLEYHPQSAMTLFVMAGLAEQGGDNAQAIELYKKVLAIQPDNRRAQERLEALGGGG